MMTLKHWYAHYDGLYPAKGDEYSNPDARHEWLLDKAMTQTGKQENMLWFGVWSTMTPAVRDKFGLPKFQKAFCDDWLDCSDRQVRKWRQKHPWFFTYLDSMAHVGKAILEQAEDSIFRMIASEAMRPDSVGYHNRRLATEITGSLVKRSDVTSKDQKIAPAVNVAVLADKFDGYWGEADDADAVDAENTPE